MRVSRGTADTLTAVASLTGWATPTKRDHKDGQMGNNTLIRGERTESNALLGRQVWLAAWPTPNANPDAPNMSKNRGSDHGGERSRYTLQSLGEAAKNIDVGLLTGSGEMPCGFPADPKEKAKKGGIGQLNPAHSRWLMGLPSVWDDCGVMAMESLRHSRKPSSSATSKSAE